ncbi:MAG: hypothetical protein R6X22_14240, partial [Gemmatimonadota bacterium]
MTQITLPGFEALGAGRAAENGGDAQPTGNAILRIAPYWHHGTWAFDDEPVGIVVERPGAVVPVG